MRQLVVFLAVLYFVGGSRADLIARWHFDESTGSVARDAVGSREGVLSPGASFVPNGVSGGALRLRRDEFGTVNLGTDGLALTNSSFSLSVWFKTNPDEKRWNMVILSKGDWIKDGKSWKKGYWLNANPTASLGFGDFDRVSFFTAGTLQISTTRVTDGTWHHVVGVSILDGKQCIYIDGAPAESCDIGGRVEADNTPLLLGAFSGLPKELGTFDGWIDELSLFDHALSDQEVSDLFRNPAGTPVEPQVLIFPEQTLFTNSVTITLQNKLSAGEIHYTTNGQPVTADSPKYEGAIRSTTNLTINSAVFFNKFIVSTVSSRTYHQVFALDDGISNEWRREYFGPGFLTDPRVSAHQDPDGDGQDNLKEFLSGTDPLDPRSIFRASVIAIPRISFPSKPGKTYRILMKSLLPSLETVEVARVVASGTTTTFVHADADGLGGIYFIEAVQE